jgi:hypothetical protein
MKTKVVGSYLSNVVSGFKDASFITPAAGGDLDIYGIIATNKEAMPEDVAYAIETGDVEGTLTAFIGVIRGHIAPNVGVIRAFGYDSVNGYNYHTFTATSDEGDVVITGFDIQNALVRVGINSDPTETSIDLCDMPTDQIRLWMITRLTHSYDFNIVGTSIQFSFSYGPNGFTTEEIPDPNIADFPPLCCTAKPDTAKYSITGQDPAVRAEMDGGYVVTRARYTRRPRREISLGFTNISESDRQCLLAFFEEMRGGSDMFTFREWGTTDMITVRFKSVPTASYKGVGQYKRWDYDGWVLEEV